MTKLIVWVVLILSTSLTNAEIFVSNISINTIEQQDFVQFSQAKIHPLGMTRPGDAFDVTVMVDNDVYKDISAYVVDEVNLNLMKQGQRFNMSGAEKGISPIQFKAIANSYMQHYLILDNRYAMLIDKKVRFKVSSYSIIPPEKVKEIQQLMGQLYTELKKSFIFDDFSIRIEPCNQANAFSNPNITLCAELINELTSKGKQGALYGIFLHEIGHSFLNLWGLPGFDNEDIADEFAASMLVRNESGKKALYEMMAWFSEHNLHAQVENMVTAGDRHSLSIQRIRNMEQVLANPVPVTARWNKMLYPHYTDEALKKTIQSPDLYDDIELASSILAQRKK